jgi:hypothetical protein
MIVEIIGFFESVFMMISRQDMAVGACQSRGGAMQSRFKQLIAYELILLFLCGFKSREWSNTIRNSGFH